MLWDYHYDQVGYHGCQLMYLNINMTIPSRPPGLPAQITTINKSVLYPLSSPSSPLSGENIFIGIYHSWCCVARGKKCASEFDLLLIKTLKMFLEKVLNASLCLILHTSSNTSLFWTLSFKHKENCFEKWKTNLFNISLKQLCTSQ